MENAVVSSELKEVDLGIELNDANGVPFSSSKTVYLVDSSTRDFLINDKGERASVVKEDTENKLSLKDVLIRSLSGFSDSIKLKYQEKLILADILDILNTGGVANFSESQVNILKESSSLENIIIFNQVRKILD